MLVKKKHLTAIEFFGKILVTFRLQEDNHG
jgi:hypothetical protein